MSIFLNTIANLKCLKGLLMTDFEMKSSHASEAIAALIGFKSHNGLRQATSSNQKKTVHDVDFERFEERSLALGYDSESSEWLRYAFATIAFPDRTWLLINKHDNAARDHWFYKCEDQRLPFIVIEKARKHFTVSWDHASMDSEYDTDVRASYGDELRRIMFRTYQMICGNGVDPKSFFEGSWAVGDIRGLSDSSARQIANAFAKLLCPANFDRKETIT